MNEHIKKVVVENVEVPVETLFDGTLIFFPLSEYFDRFMRPHVFKGRRERGQRLGNKDFEIKYTARIRIEEYSNFKSRKPISVTRYNQLYCRAVKEKIKSKFAYGYCIRRIRYQRNIDAEYTTYVFEVVRAKGKGYTNFNIKLYPYSCEFEITDDKNADRRRNYAYQNKEHCK